MVATIKSHGISSPHILGELGFEGSELPPGDEIAVRKAVGNGLVEFSLIALIMFFWLHERNCVMHCLFQNATWYQPEKQSTRPARFIVIGLINSLYRDVQ